MGSAGGLKLGIIGWPLGYSLSPLMHRAALKACGLEGEYEQCPIPLQSGEESGDVNALISESIACYLKERIQQWQDQGKLLHGFNVTMPFKRTAYLWVYENGSFLETRRQRGFVAGFMGVINTVKMEAQKPVGCNTDGEGFHLTLQQAGLDPGGKSVILLGAGGAARAVAATLVLEGEVEKVMIQNRTLEHAQDLARGLRALADSYRNRNVTVEIAQGIDSLPVEKCDFLVNATPVGMTGYGEAPQGLLLRLTPKQVVCDIVYQPRVTGLVKAARAQGCTVITGDAMLAAQGALSFEIWTGEKAKKVLPVMKKALDEHFAAGG